MTRFSAVASVLLHIRAWPSHSHMTARRNAMVACTALAQRRAEREDVEDFFASLVAGAAPHAGAAGG